jgi:hypothetical protein
MTKAVVSAAVASFGGILVFVGLWMEKGAEKGWFLNVNDLRKRRLKAKWGWRVLMLGIFVEIGTGAALTWHDVAENMQTAKQIAKNDPLNQPIASLTANAFFLQVGTNRTHIDPKKIESRAVWIQLRLGRSEQLKTNGEWDAMLICSSCESSSSSTNTWWFIEFSRAGFGQFGPPMPNGLVARTGNEWDAAEVDALFLPDDTEILEGELTLTINGATTRIFPIPRQKTKGAGTSHILKLNAITINSW